MLRGRHRPRRRRRASLQIVVNPLVNWIWLGFGVLAFGTGIALLPERAYSFALAKLPAERGDDDGGAAAGAGARLGGSTLSRSRMPARRRRRHADARSTRATDFEKKLQHEIVCTCGCGHTTIAECRKDPCGTSHEMRGELAALIDQGKSHDEIIQAFVRSYGSEEMLGAPIDKGFNRLAWLFPYLVGARRRRRRRLRRRAVVAPARRRPPRRPRRPIPTSTSASTMSSETSTESRQPTCRLEAGRHDRTDDRSRPSALAVLRARGARLRDGRRPSSCAARASRPSSCSAC